jgi:hypothetical protein
VKVEIACIDDKKRKGIRDTEDNLRWNIVKTGNRKGDVKSRQDFDDVEC